MGMSYTLIWKFVSLPILYLKYTRGVFNSVQEHVRDKFSLGYIAKKIHFVPAPIYVDGRMPPLHVCC